VGLAVAANAPKIRTIHAPIVEPRAILTTRTSDTEGVWTLPAGCRLPQREADDPWTWHWTLAVGDPTTLTGLTTPSQYGQTTYQITVDSLDAEARTVTGTLASIRPAQPDLPAVNTVGVPGPLTLHANPATYTAHATPATVHDLIFPARVDLTVSGWTLFDGAWELLHNWASLAPWPTGPAAYAVADCDDWLWPGWSTGDAPDDTPALTWNVDDCPPVWGRLTTRASNTAGTITFPSAGHEIEEGDTVSIGWTSTSVQRTGATVSAVAGAAVSFSGGAGANLPALDTDSCWLQVTTDGDDQAAIATGRMLNPDTTPLYGDHVTTTTTLTLARRLDPLNWTTGPLRADGPADNLTLDRGAIRTPYRLQFSWAAATDDPITVLARTFPDPTTGEWTATLQFPDRADGWTVPDDTFGARFGIYGAFTGSVTAYDDATNQITWEGSSNPWNLFATLSTRTSATVGILTTSAIYHLVDTGAPITLSWASGTASTAATVTSRTDAAFTFEADGAGDALPTEGTTIYVTGRNALPPPEGAYDDATGTTTWYARTYRHFDADFSLASELVDLIPLE
jgi:hypothetical protein